MDESQEFRSSEDGEAELEADRDAGARLSDDESPNGPLPSNPCEVCQGVGYYCNPPGQVDVHGSPWHICGECAGRGTQASAKTPPRQRPTGVCAPRFSARSRQRTSGLGAQ
jgi:hypothetical protein